MAAYFIDLDGTVMRYHTNEFLPGVVDALTDLVRQGHHIHFITMRGPQDAGTEWSMDRTVTALETLPFPASVFFAIQGSRVLVDDTAPRAILATTDDPTSWLTGVSHA